MSSLLEKLKGGDLRSIGRSDEVVRDILNEPTLFNEVFEGILSNDPLIRMRSADAIEKVSSIKPSYLQPYKNRLIDEVSQIEQQEVRWHLAQMFSYIEINEHETDRIVSLLLNYIDNDRSKIVQVNSIQTLTNLAVRYQRIKPVTVNKLQEIIRVGSSAVVSRARKLLERLAQNQ